MQMENRGEIVDERFGELVYEFRGIKSRSMGILSTEWIGTICHEFIVPMYSSSLGMNET